MPGPTVSIGLDELLATRAEVGPPGAPPPGNGPRAGTFRGPQRGRGMDFDDLRPYADGDDVRHIDWKASARTGETQVRLHREEVDHAVTLALDLRDAMFTGSARLRAVKACLEAARRAWRHAADGSRVGLVVFDAEGIEASRPATGERGALGACALAASRFAARAAALDAGARGGPSSAPRPAPSLDRLVDRLLVERRALGEVVLVTGLDDVAGADATAADGTGSAAASLARLALAVPTTVALVEDPIEREPLPVGRYRWATSGGTMPGRIATVALGRRGRRRLRDALAARRRSVETLCRSAGVALEGAAPSDASWRDAPWPATSR